MAARMLSTNTKVSILPVRATTSAVLVTRPASLGSGNYTFWADGTIWDNTNGYAIPPERTNHPQFFASKTAGD